MADIYYCKNEEDRKRVALHILKEIDSIDEGLALTQICYCSYIGNDVEECNECEYDGCLIWDHFNDKDVYKHIELMNEDIEYPAIICVAGDTWDKAEISICSIADAKLNTKYGIER